MHPLVVRSPAKLQKLLSDRKISSETISTHLTTIEGNVKDVAAVTKTLRLEECGSDVVDIIISGIGGTPTFKPNPLKPSLDDPTVCQDAMKTILSALRAMSSSSATSTKKPLLVALSTTGISDAGRDIPLAMIPLYHWLLAVPHEDKKEMERLLVAERSEKSVFPVIRAFIVIRASLLTNGERLGVEKVRVGTETMAAAERKAAVGYMISRADVGGWIYDKVVCPEEEQRKSWFDQMVSITY